MWFLLFALVPSPSTCVPARHDCVVCVARSPDQLVAFAQAPLSIFVSAFLFLWPTPHFVQLGQVYVFCVRPAILRQQAVIICFLVYH
jgi:hypothetical protein